MFIYNRSNKYIINKLNKLDFTYKTRLMYTNKYSNSKNLALNNFYKNNKTNITNKSSYNDLLCNINSDISLVNQMRLKFKNKAVQHADNVLYTHGFKNKYIKKTIRKNIVIPNLYINNILSLNTYKHKLKNQYFYIKPKYLKLKNSEVKLKKINKHKLCLFTRMYNNKINNQKKYQHKNFKFTQIPMYVIRRLKYNTQYKVKLFNKKYNLYNIKKHLDKNEILNITISKKFKSKKNPNNLFCRFKLKKTYRNKQRNINRKYKKNLRSDFILNRCISKFKLIKHEMFLIKYLKQCLNMVGSDLQFNNKYVDNISSKLFTNIYGIFKLYNLNNKKNYLINQLHKKIIIYYKQMLIIDKFKFDNFYLAKLKMVLSKLYNKDINFNIVNLRYPNLNSNIYTQIICLKAKSRKFAIRTIFNKALNPLRLKRTVKFLYKNKNLQFDKFKNIYINKKNQNYKDLLTNNINYCFDTCNNNISTVESFVFSSLKNKYLKGVKLQGKGRLTKRLTASRSVFKYGQKGSIRNFKSSYTGLYGYLLRSHVDSNVQYTKLEAKNRNGAFGLKGWFSSM